MVAFSTGEVVIVVLVVMLVVMVVVVVVTSGQGRGGQVTKDKGDVRRGELTVQRLISSSSLPALYCEC